MERCRHRSFRTGKYGGVGFDIEGISKISRWGRIWRSAASGAIGVVLEYVSPRKDADDGQKRKKLNGDTGEVKH